MGIFGGLSDSAFPNPSEQVCTCEGARTFGLHNIYN